MARARRAAPHSASRCVSSGCAPSFGYAASTAATLRPGKRSRVAASAAARSVSRSTSPDALQRPSGSLSTEHAPHCSPASLL